MTDWFAFVGFLGLLLTQMSLYSEAEPHLLQAHTAFKRIYSVTPHVSTYSALSNLASLYGKMSKWHRALPLSEECLAGFKTVLGTCLVYSE